MRSGTVTHLFNNIFEGWMCKSLDPCESGIRLFLVTGDPASGKTTVVSKVILALRTKGYTVGGVLTREVKSHGERQGFNLIDLSTEESAPLASAHDRSGPRVGKYFVNLRSLSTLGVKALEHAGDFSDVIVCDEVGPMELFSPEYRRAISSVVVGSTKPCLCVVHKRLSDPLIDEIKSNERAKLFEINFENRGEAPQKISEEMLDFLEDLGPGKV